MYDCVIVGDYWMDDYSKTDHTVPYRASHSSHIFIIELKNLYHTVPIPVSVLVCTYGTIPCTIVIFCASSLEFFL